MPRLKSDEMFNNFAETTYISSLAGVLGLVQTVDLLLLYYCFIVRKQSTDIVHDYWPRFSWFSGSHSVGSKTEI